MKTKKISLLNLKVKSFLTDSTDQKSLKGGYVQTNPGSVGYCESVKPRCVPCDNI